MNEIYKGIKISYDDAIIEAFEQHGYSKAWLMDERNTERVTMYQMNKADVSDVIVNTFFVDDTALFSVHQHMSLDIDPVSGSVNGKLVWDIRSYRD